MFIISSIHYLRIRDFDLVRWLIIIVLLGGSLCPPFPAATPECHPRLSSVSHHCLGHKSKVHAIVQIIMHITSSLLYLVLYAAMLTFEILKYRARHVHTQHHTTAHNHTWTFCNFAPTLALAPRRQKRGSLLGLTGVCLYTEPLVQLAY